MDRFLGADKRLLVTGASGLLGWHLCRAALDRWSVFGTWRTRRADLAGVRSLRCDLTGADSVPDLFRDVRPHAVVHAAAAADPNFCETHPEETARINVEAPARLAEACAAAGIPLVFTSTDLVFDGEHAPYREGDPVSPLMVYGRQKVRAETAVAEIHPGAAILRMPLMFGISPAGDSFFEKMAAAFAAGEPVRLFIDEYRSPLAAPAAAHAVLSALAGGGGLLHLGGPERISRHDSAVRTARAMGATPARIIPVRQAEVPMAAARPRDVSLANEAAARRIGFRPEPLDVELERLARTPQKKR